MVNKYKLCHYDPYLVFMLDKLWRTLKSGGQQNKILFLETFLEERGK